MRARVYVTLKKTVLDPQGQTIHRALRSLGFAAAADVRQGKFFDIELDGSLTREQAQAEVERMARELLANPIIEEFRCEIVE